MGNNKFSGQIVPGAFKFGGLKLLNLSSNSFDGMFPCLNNFPLIVLIDARYNNFQFVESKCNWSHTLDYFLLSVNKQLTQSFDDITYHMSDMKMLSLSNTRIYGTVTNTDPFYTGCKVFSIRDTDIATKLPNVWTNATFNQTWVVLGLTIAVPHGLPQYVSPVERELKRNFVPLNDFFWYITFPLSFCGFYLVLYVFYFHCNQHYVQHGDTHSINVDMSLHNYLRRMKISCDGIFPSDEKSVHLDRLSLVANAPMNRNSNKRINIFDTTINQQLVAAFHNMMLTVHHFLFYLLCVSGLLGFSYFMGANWVQEGFHSLFFSAAYLGSHNKYNYAGIVIVC